MQVLDKRRPRDVPVSTGKWVSPWRDRGQQHPREHVFTWAEMLDRHGDLPGPFLYDFTKHILKSESRAKDWLTDLFHEDQTPFGGPLLDRPKYQFATYRPFNTRIPRNEHLVYGKNVNTIAALKQENRYHEHTPEPSNSPRHDFNRSCFTASIHLTALGAPHRYEYIFHDAIVELIKTDRFTVSGSILKPDCFFAINYLPTGEWIVFIVEVDRHGKPAQWRRKFNLYRELIGHGKYKDVFWKNARLMLISIFDSPGKMKNIMQEAHKLSGGMGFNYMLFKSIPYYAGHFAPPPIMRELLYEPYLRAGREPFSLSSPPGR